MYPQLEVAVFPEKNGRTGYGLVFDTDELRYSQEGILENYPMDDEKASYEATIRGLEWIVSHFGPDNIGVTVNLFESDIPRQFYTGLTQTEQQFQPYLDEIAELESQLENLTIVSWTKKFGRMKEASLMALPREEQEYGKTYDHLGYKQ